MAVQCLQLYRKQITASLLGVSLVKTKTLRNVSHCKVILNILVKEGNGVANAGVNNTVSQENVIHDPLHIMAGCSERIVQLFAISVRFRLIQALAQQVFIVSL